MRLRPKRKASREQPLVRSVMELLQAHGFRVHRRNTGGMTKEYERKDGTKKERFVRFSEPGMADIWGWHIGTGKHIEVEVKAPGREPSDLQRQWLEQAEKDGSIAFWCDSMEMAIWEINRWKQTPSPKDTISWPQASPRSSSSARS